MLYFLIWYFSEWISPQLIANISSTLSRIIGEQKAVDQRLENFIRSSANQISGLEGRLQNSMNSWLRSVSEAINALKASTQVSEVHSASHIRDCPYFYVVVVMEGLWVLAPH